jgi:hypothetical protein
VQFDMQAVFAAGFVAGVSVAPPPGGTETGMPGTRQLVWQLAAVALQPIKQVVVADEIVDDTGGGGATVGNACASTPCDAATLTTAATRRLIKLRMSASDAAQAKPSWHERMRRQNRRRSGIERIFSGRHDVVAHRDRLPLHFEQPVFHDVAD